MGSINAHQVCDRVVNLDRLLTRRIASSEFGAAGELFLLPGCKAFGWTGTPFTLILSLLLFGLEVFYFQLLSVSVAQIISRVLKGFFQRVRPAQPVPMPFRTITTIQLLPSSFCGGLVAEIQAPKGQPLRMDGDGPSFPSGQCCRR